MRANVTLSQLVLFVVVWFNTVAQDMRISPYAQLEAPNREKITAFSFSGDGKLLAAGDDDGEIVCWDLTGRRIVAQMTMKSTVIFLGFLSGDRTIVGVDDGGRVDILDLLKGAVTTSFRTKAKPLSVCLDAGKQYLAVATTDERIEVFDLKALMPFGIIDAREKIEDLLFLGFDRLGQQLVAITKLAQVVSWNPATSKLLREVSLGGGELHGSRSVIHAAATNRASNIFVVSLEEVALPKGGLRGSARPGDLVRESKIIAYDWNSGIEVKRVKTQETTERIVLGPGNDHVACINDDDNTITLVDLRKGEVGSTVSMDERPTVLAVSEDNKWLVAGTKNGKVSVWSLQFKDDVSVRAANLPSLSGRIRTRSGVEPALKPGEPIRLAILSFEAKGLAQDVADVCLNSLSNGLANFEYITLIERRDIEKVVQEQRFQMSDLTDERTSVQVGKLLNADNVLLCGIGKLGASMILTARLISVETGKVLKAREVICEECRDQDIYDAVSMLVSTLAQ